jgi:hypothetical protein
MKIDFFITEEQSKILNGLFVDVSFKGKEPDIRVRVRDGSDVMFDGNFDGFQKFVNELIKNHREAEIAKERVLRLDGCRFIAYKSSLGWADDYWPDFVWFRDQRFTKADSLIGPHGEHEGQVYVADVQLSSVLEIYLLNR